MKMQEKLLAIRSLVAAWLPDGLMVGGAAAVSYGTWLVHSPAGYIVAGVLAIVAGIMAARAGSE